MTLTETNQSITVCMRACVCVCGRWVWISLTHYCPQPSKRAVLSLIIKVYLLEPPSFFSFLSTLFSLLTIPKHSSPTLIPYYLWTPSFFISTLPFYLLPLIHLIINFLSLISPSFIFLCSTHFSLCLSIHHHLKKHRNLFNQPFHSFIHLLHRSSSEGHRCARMVLRQVRHSLLLILISSSAHDPTTFNWVLLSKIFILPPFHLSTHALPHPPHHSLTYRIRPTVMNKFPLYLKALYESDAEVVDEAAIKSWHTGAAGEW